MIIFKHLALRLTHECDIRFYNLVIKGEPSVKLLEMHLDQHFKMCTHIDNTLKRCQGFLSVMAKASSVLPQQLIKMFNTAFIRAQLKYASSVVSMASCTNLHKFDLIQKATKYIIYRSERLAHTERLLAQLELQTLEHRHTQHIYLLIYSYLTSHV